MFILQMIVRLKVFEVLRNFFQKVSEPPEAKA